jgi:purine-cytosine permease-like protein
MPKKMVPHQTKEEVCVCLFILFGQSMTACLTHHLFGALAALALSCCWQMSRSKKLFAGGSTKSHHFPSDSKPAAKG